MDVARVRKVKSVFKPWNSYLAKKGVNDARLSAKRYDVARKKSLNDGQPHVAGVVRLTKGLLDTYEGINEIYYRKKAQLEQGKQRPTSDILMESTRAKPTVSLSSGNVGGTKKKKKKITTKSSSLSAQYCDENFDYIVRTGETFNNRYMLEKVIGRGSFGQVVRAYDTREDTHVAIKIIKNNSLYVEQALSEVRMTSYLNRIDPEDAHSIMRLRDKFIFRGHQCLVLELLSFSLYDLLRSTEFYGVSLNLVRKFCKQILNCLAFLARPDVNIAHCDLKPENVLLRHPQRSAIKVVDFGASCRISESMFTYVQSRFYRAPEVILGLPYGTQVDIWSLGCMLIELHTGYPLFAGKDEGHQIAIIVERLGMPPMDMLRNGKKTGLFFDHDPEADRYSLKASLCGDHGTKVAGSKPIDAFVEYHTGGGSGRRKRMSGGHSELDYEMFLSLCYQMLRYEPEERITADNALKESFVRGGCGRSGRESPPQLPMMGQDGLKERKEVDPGRQAPVQRTRIKNRVEFEEMVGVHNDASIGDLAEVTRDVGGKLRLSKSEPAFEGIEKKTFVFKQSDWAEMVGIEPPPWRAGGGGEWGETRKKGGGCGGGVVKRGMREWGEWRRYGEVLRRIRRKDEDRVNGLGGIRRAGRGHGRAMAVWVDDMKW